MTTEELNAQLQELRVAYRNATSDAHKKLIEIRANLLKKKFGEPPATNTTEDLVAIQEAENRKYVETN